MFPAKEKVEIGEMKVQKQKGFFYFGVLMILSSTGNSLRCNIGNCKNLELILLQRKDN